MTQQVVLAKCILKSNDALVDDASWSTHWEQLGSDTQVNVTTIENRIIAFMNTVATGGTHAMCYYISRVMSRAAAATAIEIYDITGHLNGSPHGSTISISHFQLGNPAPTVTSMPEGVACTFGYRVDYGTDVEFSPGARPRARDRNRFYLGPLNSQLLSEDTTTFRSKFPAAFITDALASLSALLAAGTGSSDVTSPVVWSRAGAAVKQPIVQGWIQDSATYERLRKDPSTKQLVSI